MSIHKDHRQRLKTRFQAEGLDGFNEHQVLELLLFYCIPRRDTNVIAHSLLERFGSLSNVIDAPAKELEKVVGMGPNAAVFLNLICQVQRYYQVNRNQQTTILKTIEECGKYLMPFFFGRNKETVFLLCMDAKCKVLCCREVAEGNVNSTGISIRKIVDIALTENATSVVLAHNHPSGVAIPSAEDIITTKKIAKALRFVDVALVDHVVVADDDYVSLLHSRFYKPDEDEL